MSDLLFAGLMLFVLFCAIAIRIPVGIAMLVVGGLGYMEMTSFNALISFLKSSVVGRVANYDLSVITLFVLMGELATQSGLGQKFFRGANAWVGHRKGGLAMASIAGSAGFGAICGSSLATVATMTRIALPEMRRYNYPPGLATGALAGGGTLGILIPPSIVLVIYALLTEQSVSDLFAAALLPGVLATLLYLAVVAIVARRQDGSVARSEPLPLRVRLKETLGVLPMLGVFVFIMTGMYAGLFTPTEAAAVGSVAVGFLSFAFGMRWAGLKQAILNTGATTAMCFLILISAELFNSFLALSRLPMELAGLTQSLALPPLGVVAAMLLIYLALGCVMDSMSTILLTVPVFFPIVIGLDLGMSETAIGVWFGILALMTCEIGLITPPFGLNVFIIHGLARDVPMTTIFRGVFPFFLSDLVRVGLVLVFPAIALLIPGL
ncbi:TRAP transporter large permease [Martelella endophytica]|uniref:TRAP transporter large permease protein n=1 Tax=Martelella endophytica TaxID=1486262 RepID=A0A0D5LNG7_MAREN|nr:TRAP transporter large permease [Martelella endophytica]AJY45470.1 C4-dicarboxylate ABC transporter permease [Martelella endophytica]